MTKHIISKNLLAFYQAKRVLMVESVIYGIGAALFILVSVSSAVIGAGFTAALYFCYRNAQKGKENGFNWAAMINGMVAFSSLWYLWLVREAATFRLVVIVAILAMIAGFFIVVYLRGMRAHMDIPEKIDIPQTLETFAEKRQQDKESKTYSAKAFRESLKDGTFEMQLIYKESEQSV